MFVAPFKGKANATDPLVSPIYSNYMSDFPATIILTSNDKVSMFFTNSGHNSGSFLGNGPSHIDAKWNGMGFYRIEDGKIAEAWLSEDLLQMFAQLSFINV
ncbi:ester cyclase [Mucilaginibacter endophyticus]|uniref:ester cyclase n=1 Tax=Mucilaginibacter endophyticus TaxID=2675003 RepID=UPI000E0D52DF|nr:ester cyclase [Mucilaginibacter endophyticus]